MTDENQKDAGRKSDPAGFSGVNTGGRDTGGMNDDGTNESSMKTGTINIGGIYAAALTPMQDDLCVDHDRLARHSRWLLDNGCNGVVLMGTTGEANSLSVPERKTLLERILSAGLPPERLIVGTGCCAFTDTLDLTLHAVERAVAGVLVLPPFYYKKVPDAGLFAAFDNVIQSVNERFHDAHCPIILYHFPQMAGIGFSDNLVRKLVEAHPTVIGMKDSSGDFKHMSRLSRTLPDFRMFTGTETYLLDLLKAGGAGTISASVNVTASVCADIFKRWKAENMRPQQDHLTAVRQTLESEAFIPGLKGLFASVTGDGAWLNMRPPFVPLPELAIERIRRELERLEFSFPVVD